MTVLDADSISRLEKEAKKYEGLLTEKYHFADNIHKHIKGTISHVLKTWGGTYKLADVDDWATKWSYEKLFTNLRMALNIDSVGKRVVAATPMDNLRKYFKMWGPCWDPRERLPVSRAEAE
jgi:hypothetical protein